MEAIRRGALWCYDRLVIYGGLILLGLLSVGWTVGALLLYPLLPERQARALGRAVAMGSFRFYLGCLTLSRRFSFDTEALDALRDAPPLIIAPNHPGMLDALMVISRLPNVACVLKNVLMNNPVFGAGARFSRFIRAEPAACMAQLAIRDVACGSHLLLFPEGTRTTQDPVNPLQGCVALIASRARVPIQTVLIETNTKYLSKGWHPLRVPPMPMHFRVRLGKRFDPPADAHQFMADLSRYFSHELVRGSAFQPAASLTARGKRTLEVTPADI